MQRLLLLVSFCLLAVPSLAQEPGIDLTQNTRLDAIEVKIASMEQRDKMLLSAVEELSRVVAGVSAPKPQPAVVAPKPAPKAAVVQSACLNGVCPIQAPAKVTVQVQSNYRARWHNNDGKSLRDHIIQEHGMDPSLSNAQLYAAHDAWHDRNGGAPPSVARTRTVQRTFSSACPNGQCPAQGVQRSSGSYGPLGLIRWR